MRYYLFVVQHNAEKDAENRTAPKGYDDYNEALKDFHSQLAKDMGNATLDWSLVEIINSEGHPMKCEKWVVPQPEPEPIPEVIPEEITEE